MKNLNLVDNEGLFEEIKQLLFSARSQVLAQVNSTMVRTYFEIGRRIVEDEQRSSSRSDYYADRVVDNLSERLTREFGKGFSRSNLFNMRSFYLAYSPKIVQTPSGQSSGFRLSWSHYVFLLQIEAGNERDFYEVEAEANQWSLRELKRQFNAGLYERLSLSRDKDSVRALGQKGLIIEKPEDAIKDPYILEFLHLQDVPFYSEGNLETAIIDRLQQFMLELGKGFTFVGRQTRITLDNKHFRVDMVFFNRILQCFFLVDLKIGELTHQDIGQMQMYVNYYDRQIRLEHENPTIGLILCRVKNEAIVRYTLPEDNTQIFASRYLLILPDKEELRKLLTDEVSNTHFTDPQDA